MFDTYVTVVGTVLTAPDWKLVAKTNSIVASFRVASHSRRYDRSSDKWVDGPSLRIRVNCWRRLAEGVSASIMVGDPVLIYGRISTRDWKTEQGESRISYELDAVGVGHDLSRGLSKFERKKLDTISSVIEDKESDARVNGELTESIPALNATRLAGIGEESLDDFGYGENFAVPDAGDTDFDAAAILRDAGVDPPPPTDGEIEEDEGIESEEMAGATTDSGGSGGRGRRRGRQPVSA
jgi:single-strand DNA-binding protein